MLSFGRKTSKKNIATFEITVERVVPLAPEGKGGKKWFVEKRADTMFLAFSYNLTEFHYGWALIVFVMLYMES